jgi:para-nitrobenzyl esterase
MTERVLTVSGRVEGDTQHGVHVFRGIPYARPPRENLRWRAPEPPHPWHGTRAARAYGPSAPQIGPVGRLVRLFIGAPEGRQDQNCLSLNVWTPACDRLTRPVMVWIHGGAFILGSSAMPLYRGWRLAKAGDVVVVSLNYRLGALGFASWHSLGTQGESLPANLGLRDQIAALEWVRDNIEAFGGNPENVTIFGESAGGMSVGTLLGVPAAKGLFHKAVLQSGAAANVSSREQADEVAQRFLSELQLERPDVERLERAPVAQILRAQALTSARFGIAAGNLAWQPCIDGDLLPEQPLDAIASGASREVPVLIGTNRDEWKLFMAGDPKGRRLDEDGLTRRLRRAFAREGEAGKLIAERAIQAYQRVSGARGAEPSERWAAFQSDRIFHRPALHLADAQARHQTRTYAYQFEWSPPALEARVGACHGLDLPFVFGGLRAASLRAVLGRSPRTQHLCTRMQRAWIGFARSGDPGHDDLPDWPGYTREARSTLAFDSECTLREDPHRRVREVWGGQRTTPAAAFGEDR